MILFPSCLTGSYINQWEITSGRFKSTPAEKKSPKDLIYLGEKKNHSISSLQVHIVNRKTVLAKMWLCKLRCNVQVFDKLPKNAREEIKTFLAEGSMVAKVSLHSTLDVADVSSMVITSALIVRRSSWLQSLGIASDIQQTTKVILFVDKLLFSDKTSVTLHYLDSQATLC